MNEKIGVNDDRTGNEKLMVLWCHNEIDGTIGTYPYRKISDELERIIRDHGIGNVKVIRIRSARVSMSSNQRRLPNGKTVWLHKEFDPLWKPTDTLFSLDYPYTWDKKHFEAICSYFASIPGMDSRWEVKIVDNEINSKWSISATEETYEFLSEHWGKIPNSDPMRLSKCNAEQVKEWLLEFYEWEQRDQNTELKTFTPSRKKWLYIEDGNVIQYFYEKSEMAQYIYTSDTPKDGRVKLVVEADWSEEDLSTSENKTAKQFLALYEQFHPLFPPRDKEIPKRLQETRYIMGREKCTAKDMWERCYRSQIDSLIRSGSENHIAALVLMMPCMELVYKLKTGRPQQNWSETMKMFFPAIGFTDNTYRQLRDLVRNAFAHDGFAKGYVGISSRHHTPEEYIDSQQVFEGMRSETGQFNLLIIPAFFWARVRDRIDSFYKYEQWIPGWDMHQVFSINHYVEPLTREEITQTV